MATRRRLPPREPWIIGLVVGVIFSLCPLPGGWSNAEEPAANATRAGALVQQPRIRVQQGRLTLSLRDDDVRQVIMELGQLAGIPVILGPIPERRVSAEFTDVELEEGFRRLLRLAALNHTILYAQGPGGKLTITKVLVFGPQPGGAPLPPTAAESDSGESAADGSRHMLSAIIERQAASPAGDNGASAVMIHVREALERHREQRRQPLDGDESEAVLRVRAAIAQAIHSQTESPSPPKTADEIIALIPGALGGHYPLTAGPAESGTLRHLDVPSRGETPAP